jgi:hypothetical protein
MECRYGNPLRVHAAAQCSILSVPSQFVPALQHNLSYTEAWRSFQPLGGSRELLNAEICRRSGFFLAEDRMRREGGAGQELVIFVLVPP